MVTLKLFFKKQIETKASYLVKKSFVDQVNFETTVIRKGGRSLVEHKSPDGKMSLGKWEGVGADFIARIPD